MSSNAVAVANGAHLEALHFSADRVKLIRDTIANGAPQQEFDLFMAVCQRTGLDPIAKQIYFIKRGNRWSWQTSIDGYRLIADRTGLYAGNDDPVFAYSTGSDPRDADYHPETATVTVYKIVQGQRCAFSATARWNEYHVANNDMWKRMPHTMLAKCAEALALRKAFPADLSGLYTGEEMMQADAPEPATTRTSVAGYVPDDLPAVEADPTTGEIIEVTPADLVTSWVRDIQAAPDTGALDELGQQLAKTALDEQSRQRLAAAYSQRRKQLNAKAQPELVAVEAIEGEPGNDRFTS